jgi:hypothetical protein
MLAAPMGDDIGASSVKVTILRQADNVNYTRRKPSSRGYRLHRQGRYHDLAAERHPLASRT